MIRTISAVLLASVALSLTACSSASDGRSKGQLAASAATSRIACEDAVRQRLDGDVDFSGERQVYATEQDWPPFVASGVATTGGQVFRFSCSVVFGSNGIPKSTTVKDLVER